MQNQLMRRFCVGTWSLLPCLCLMCPGSWFPGSWVLILVRSPSFSVPAPWFLVSGPWVLGPGSSGAAADVIRHHVLACFTVSLNFSIGFIDHPPPPLPPTPPPPTSSSLCSHHSLLLFLAPPHLTLSYIHISVLSSLLHSPLPPPLCSISSSVLNSTLHSSLPSLSLSPSALCRSLYLSLSATLLILMPLFPSLSTTF